ncbi:hypothetical protein GCM10009535_40930 [Streptomyces thermocarboxydovorans]|uniref:Uncharacterized protein n=1 Tax=Streptomyces thermocarboxydovorans TaxID=59298 RepID=A0ABP3SSM6_9ACTN
MGRPDRPALATVRVLRTTAGVEEDITVTFGYGAGESVPFERIEKLAAELHAEHGLVSLLTCLRPARRDLTVPARLEPPAVPVTFSVADTDEAVRHHRLGDGTDPGAWTRLRELMSARGEQRPGS